MLPSLSSEVTPAPGLQLDDDFGQLDVSLLLQLSKHHSTDEEI